MLINTYTITFLTVLKKGIKYKFNDVKSAR